MIKKLLPILLPAVLLLSSCRTNQEEVNQSPKTMDQKVVSKVIDSLVVKNGDAQKVFIDKGVKQVAALWQTTDGNESDFISFCINNYQGNTASREKLFTKLSHGFEVLNGNYSKINKELQRPLQLDRGDTVTPIDELFGAFNPSAHFTDDFFSNRIAFITILNFPFYSLKEKTELGPKWSRREWAYARMGDMFSSRVPADVQQNASDKLTAADTYIANYNIYMGKLIDKDGKSPFPSDMKLISHWGLRDELKSQYANKENGLENQQLIYAVMKRIIDQTIPTQVINKDSCSWNPYSNVLMLNGKTIEPTPELEKRYQVLLDNFHAMKAIDKFSPDYPTYIQRNFEQQMEIPQADVEKIFIDFITSPTIKEMGKLISKRLGRPLQPFDIWYDGFKARGSMDEAKLTAMTEKKYPNTAAVQKDLPNILKKLGFTKEKADFIASNVLVESSRGAGHAWGTEMPGNVSLLRTRIGKNGMDYKGYNIAVHEFGHTVEQTITMDMVDNYMMSHVPNTALTEALAFIFQKRDLDLLGIKDQGKEKNDMLALDNAWSCYEIMGVSLVDMNVWKWLYAHPEATTAELKEATIAIAKDIWNKYYAEIFGTKDETILAIYSHMIDSPLYLSAYPIGYLADFQIEQQIAGKNFADEIIRIYSQGRLIPQLWMKEAVGSEISGEPTLKAAEKAINDIK
ncbi:MAG TPA: hypothetical protein VMW01_08480 [Williamwhitmania sp.]|nr:hypothetical protein [Williamwhitmania sp.]